MHNRIKIGILFACALTAGCEAHRASVRQWEAQQKVEREAPLRLYAECIISFVTDHPVGKLTGYETADAATSACTKEMDAYGAVLDSQGYDRNQVREMKSAAIVQWKQTALEAIARTKANSPAHN